MTWRTLGPIGSPAGSLLERGELRSAVGTRHGGATGERRSEVDQAPAASTMSASTAVEALQSDGVDLLQQGLDRTLSGRQICAVR